MDKKELDIYRITAEVPSTWDEDYPQWRRAEDYNVAVSVRSTGLTSAFVTGFTEDHKFMKVAGHAKWNPVDEYDRTFGINLAVNRAVARFYNRRAKRLAHATP